MIKKIVILGLIVCSLLVSPTISAVDTEGVIDDDLDDVLDENGEETSEAPNFDIDKLTYERDGQTVTIKLIVNEDGIIENKGDKRILKLISLDEDFINELDEMLVDMTDEEIEEFLAVFYEPYITYVLFLRTKENEYNLTYLNGEFFIQDLYATDFVDGDVFVDGNELTFTFDLLDSGDRLVNLSASSAEITEFYYPVYEDYVEGDCTDTPADTGSGSSSNTPGFEMIAVLVAIAMAFIILRRKKL